MFISEISEEKVGIYQKEVVSYFQENGRKNLSWRKTTDPWFILLSEMLLRKTASVQVEPIYQILTLMTPKDISEIEDRKLEEILRPLGIYRERTRLIKNAAIKVLQDGRDMLADESYLLSLSGVGRYATNTVLCFAFGMPKPALDRNMIRVIDRVFSLRSNRSRPHTDPMLWKAAEAFVPEENPKEYNWGVLDLSAALCRPKNPKCENCPLNAVCIFSFN